MPKLPDFTALGQRPEAQPNLGVTAYDETLTAPGRSLQRLGESIGQIGKNFEKIYKEKEREDSLVRLEDAQNKLKTKAIELKSGENGYGSIRGENVSDDFIEKYKSEFKSFTDELSSNLNQDEQAAFKKISDNVDYNLTSDMVSHSVREKESYKNKVFKDIKDIEQLNVANRYGSDNAILSSVQRVSAATAEMGKSNGYADDIIKYDITKEKGKLFEASINSALDAGDIPRAKALYNSRFIEGEDVTVVSETLDPDRRKKILESIGKADLRYEAQSKFSEILGKTSDPQELLKIAYSSTDGDLQDELIKRVNKYNAASSASVRLSQKNADDALTKYYNENGDLDNVSQRLLDDANPSTVARIKKDEKARTRAEASGEGIKTDPKDYSDLYNLYNNNRGEFNALMNDPGGPFSGYTLSAQDKKSLVRIGNKDDDIRSSPAGARQIHQAIAQITGDSNVVKNLKGTNKPAKMAQETLIKINEAIDDFKSSHNNANPNAQEMSKILSSMTIKAKKDSIFGGERSILDIQGVPAKEAVEIAKRLKQVRPEQDVTEENIKKFYERVQKARSSK